MQAVTREESKLAHDFVEFVRTYEPRPDLFAPDVVTFGIVPHARYRLDGLVALLAELREESATGSARVDDVRVDVTERGFVAEFRQSMPSGVTYWIFVRADAEGGRIRELSWYCSGALRH